MGGGGAEYPPYLYLGGKWARIESPDDTHQRTRAYTHTHTHTHTHAHIKRARTNARRHTHTRTPA